MYNPRLRASEEKKSTLAPRSASSALGVLGVTVDRREIRVPRSKELRQHDPPEVRVRELCLDDGPLRQKEVAPHVSRFRAEVQGRNGVGLLGHRGHYVRRRVRRSVRWLDAGCSELAANHLRHTHSSPKVRRLSYLATSRFTGLPTVTEGR